jgi:iron complex transport system substrate-binding protein
MRAIVVNRILSFLILPAGLLVCSCDKSKPSATPSSVPTIASMVPAATDLLVGMGASDRLVAVSTYDNDRPDVGRLPKAGNYQTVDWEVLRATHPSVLVTEISPDRQGPGFAARAAELHITTVNVKVETVDDIFTAIDVLGTAIKEPQLANAAINQMRARLDAIHQRVAGDKPVSTLLVIDANAGAVVGPGTYLDELLKLAGGTNAAEKLQTHWPTIDREMLLSLKPDAIIELLPGTSPAEREQAAAVWKHFPQLPAVKSGRVYPIYDRCALQPGWHITELAETMSRCLHP